MLESLFDKILGSGKIFSLEDRTLNAVLFSATLVSILLFIGDVFQQLSFYTYVFSLINTIILGILYFLGRQKPGYQRLLVPFYFIAYATIVYIWYTLGGIGGTCLFFSIAFIVLTPVLLTGFRRFVVIAGFIILSTILYFLEITETVGISPYASSNARLLDGLMTSISISIAFTMVMMLIMYSYRQEKQKVDILNLTKDKFLSIIAHDLKSPLNALQEIGKYLLSSHKEIPDKDRDMLINSIYTSSKKTFNLLENLLQWVQSESGLLEVNKKDINPRVLVSYNLNLLEENIKHKKIHASNKVDKALSVFADMNMIDTVIRNLIANAIKYTHEGGNITINSEIDPDSNNVKLLFKDDGVGIGDSSMKLLFDIDYKHSTRGTNNEEGTGLGLKLCAQFVEMNKGEITVSSDPGKGSTFIVSLPSA